MFRRALALIISGILWSSAIGYQSARAQAPEATRAAEESRAAVQRLGVGTKTRVEVRLQDGTKLRGHISAAGEETFAIMDSKTSAPRTVAYADVARVKKTGGGQAAWTWVIIGAAAVATVIVGVTVLDSMSGDCGAGC